MTYWVVIPARFGSTRLPGKPLMEIAGWPMIQHVWTRAIASTASRVVVATDHAEIADAVHGFGGEVVMTSGQHATGTDRLAEVAQKLNLHDQTIVVNVQGDEPLLPPRAIAQVAGLLQTEPNAGMATLCEPFTASEDRHNPNQVKVVFDRHGRALYFSRAAIPAGFPDQPTPLTYRHIGLYGYRAGFLKRFHDWQPTPLEQVEHLEQLRALEHGEWIQVAVTECDIPPGVDTQADLERARAHLNGRA